MKNKYLEAISVLGEMLLELKNDNQWKDTQLEIRDKEIEKLKTKIDYVEKYMNDVSQGKEKE